MAFLSLLVAPFTGWLKGRSERAAIKEAAKTKLTQTKAEAEVVRAGNLALTEGNYDVEAQRQMQHSWKDEYLVLVLTAPFIGSFIPVVQDSVIKGWTYVSKAPEWYQVAFIGIIVATFGLRWYAKSFTKK